MNARVRFHFEYAPTKFIIRDKELACVPAMRTGVSGGQGDELRWDAEVNEVDYNLDNDIHHVSLVDQIVHDQSGRLDEEEVAVLLAHSWRYSDNWVDEEFQPN